MVKQEATFDTSFWTNAFRAGLLPLLLDRFALRFAAEVAAELPETNPGGREFWRLVRAGKVQIAVPTALHIHEHGAGERAAISLAIEHPDWALLIDDRRPFLAARRMGLLAVCTPVLVVRLAEERVLSADQADTLLRRLAGFNTVSPYLIGEAMLLLRRPSEATEAEQ